MLLVMCGDRTLEEKEPGNSKVCLRGPLAVVGAVEAAGAVDGVAAAGAVDALGASAASVGRNA